MAEPRDIPFVFAGAGLDRLAERRTDNTWVQSQLTDPETRFVPVLDEDNVLNAAGAPLLLKGADAHTLLNKAGCTILLGEYRGHICFALGLAADTLLPADNPVRTNLRPQFGVMESGTLALLGYARAMVHWQRHNRYCGKCGAPTESRRAGHELHCTRCGNILYPRVNPAIITLVTHGGRCLLGRQSPGNRFSTLAGYVEPGETPESALRREVREETNIRVAELRYASSQPWPYPASLMLGFYARAENTDIRCNDGELLEARWFSRTDIAEGLRNKCLTISTPQSIAYRLIQEWFDTVGDARLDELVHSSHP